MLYEKITLCLMKIKGVGPKTITNFWKSVDATSSQLPQSAAQLHMLLTEQLKKHPSLPQLEAHWLQAEETIEQCSESSITILGRTIPLPKQVASIENPPLLLFAEGNIDALHQKAIAIIGTREVTAFGEKSGVKMASTLVEQGWCIVSGLAEGCDTAAHVGALEAEGTTVAVLAHGAGKIYPASNKGLAADILSNGGCLVSEYPPGTPATRGSFVARDRLQSGLSNAIIVIETDIEGGTMHTVGFAEKQSRAIATLSHPTKYLSAPKTQGNQFLIRENRAIGISNKAELLNFAADQEATKEPFVDPSRSTTQSKFDF